MDSCGRLWEIDALRGLAVLMMILYNFLFDLHFFLGSTLVSHLFWDCFARTTAGLFMLLAGVSLTLSEAKARARGAAGFSKFLKRGLRLLGWALAVTAATRLVVGRAFVVFGVLHLIGLSVIVAYPFLRRPRLCLTAAFATVGLGLYLGTIVLPFPWLVWAGIRYPQFTSVDYTPIFPWLGVVLLGVFLGQTFLPAGTRSCPVPAREPRGPARILAFLGRNSLLIYFLHQPLLLSGVFLAGSL